MQVMGWYLQLSIVYSLYLFIFFLRKSYQKKKEIQNQLILGLASLIISFIAEQIGISLKLWTYFPNNWPIAVWIVYFGIGLLAYQFVKLVDEITS